MLLPMPKKAPHKFRTYYHVSPWHTEASIREYGINPRFSQTWDQSVYFVDHHRIPWAVIHCSKRHGIHTGELKIWRCYVATREAKHVNRTPGLFYSETVIKYAELFTGWSPDRLPRSHNHANL